MTNNMLTEPLKKLGHGVKYPKKAEPALAVLVYLKTFGHTEANLLTYQAPTN